MQLSASENFFSGECVLLSGGASGIGKATVEEFVKRGARVVFADIDEEGGRALEGKLNEGQDCVRFIRADFEQENAWDAVLAAIPVKDWQPSILVSNIGLGLGAPITEVMREDYDRLQSCNLGSAIFGVKKVLPFFPPTGGVILFVGSVMAHTIFPNSSVYASTKAALGGLMRALTIELAPRETRVNMVSPGFTKVDPCEHFRNLIPRKLWPEFIERFGSKIESGFTKLQPLPRCISAQDIAQSICFLCSDEARCITGVELVVDGGLNLACATTAAQVENNLDWSPEMQQWVEER